MRHFNRGLVCCLLLVLVLLSAPRSGVAEGRGQADDPWAYPALPGELLVGFRESSPFVGSQRFSRAFEYYLDAHGVISAGAPIGDGLTYRFRFAPGDDLRARREAFLSDPQVTFAEPNYLMSILKESQQAATGPLEPNDENYKQQWGPSRVGADLTWNRLTTGGPVVIAILDTGVSPTHPDLKEHLKPGYNFISNDAFPIDDNGHGTFTAGIMAATGNNRIGVAGISWGALVIPVKVLDKDGLGPVSAFVEGMRFAVDQGAQIINVSAGLPLPEDARLAQSLESAVSYAIGKGVTVVAASGNRPDGQAYYPAAFPNVIAVSASTLDDKVAAFSSFGSYIWLAAPGKDIVSTYYSEGDTYAQLSGTSAAAPFVTGTIALMMSQRGNLNLKTVREILRATAVDIETAGFDPKAGYGRLDTFHATILAGQPAPTLPTAQISPPSGRDIDSFVLTASGFDPTEPLTIWLIDKDGQYRYFSRLNNPQAYASASGEARFVIGGSEPLTEGTQQVTIFGEQSNKVATGQFSVKRSVNTKPFERVAPVAETDSLVYFAQTGHTLRNAFLRYWQAHGGLPIFGFPLSEEFTEVSAVDGKPYLVQYFERNRFEYHPENAGSDYAVLLGLLGNDVTKGRSFALAPPPYQSSDTRAYFPQTKHSLTGPFLDYWQANGGLAIFGYPISEQFMEVSQIDGKPYLVQYFERNRFEYHPEINDPVYQVLLGLLGIEIARQNGYIVR